jgi:hypothetical protein
MLGSHRKGLGGVEMLVFATTMSFSRWVVFAQKDSTVEVVKLVIQIRVKQKS